MTVKINRAIALVGFLIGSKKSGDLPIWNKSDSGVILTSKWSCLAKLSVVLICVTISFSKWQTRLVLLLFVIGLWKQVNGPWLSENSGYISSVIGSVIALVLGLRQSFEIFSISRYVLMT